jgi:hypothetical protein
MHRVYNSAFMNMLKNEENSKYRATIKNTLEFDPEVLKRFVNLMNNPDEETAVAQFGKGDKYFGICTLLVTMPGLPMFGHGQIEGFEEKYGMEYRRSYRDETPDAYLVERHEREIFPLMKQRRLFSGSADFCLYDFYGPDGGINENVFAYSNRAGDDRALIFYNNSYYQASGWINRGAVAIPQKDGSRKQDSLFEAFGLHGENRFFTVFREQRRNLWFIRSSKEIAEGGLFAALNGYEAQVFLDFREKEDAVDARPGSWEGRWALLHHELNGRPVRDIDEALLDILLSELYVPFREILSKPRMEALSHFFSPPKNGISVDLYSPLESSHEFADSCRESVDTFVAAAEKFIDGGNGKFKAWKNNGKDDRREKSGEEHKGIKEWFLGLENLLALAENKPSTAQAARAKKTVKKDSAEAFLFGFSQKIGERPALAFMALGYNTLALLRSIAVDGSGAEAAALALHWQLDRLLRECWEAAGIPRDEALRGAEIALALLHRTGSAVAGTYRAAKTPGALAAALILENYDSEDFRKILGVNRFDDVIWFNKEAFEAAMPLVSLFLALETPGAFGKKTETEKERRMRIETIAAVSGVLRKAKEASGYRFDELSGALAGL